MKTEESTKYIIDNLHTLKSNLSGIKVIIDEELNGHIIHDFIDKKILNTIKSMAKIICSYKEISKISYGKSLAFIKQEDIMQHIENQLGRIKKLKTTLNIKNRKSDYFVPLSIQDARLIVSNITINSIEAGCSEILFSCDIKKEFLVLEISDNGSSADLSKSSEYISGISTKENGTGSGLSSIKKILNLINSDITFVKSINGFSTTLRISIKLIKNNYNSLIKFINKKIMLSEIIVLKDIVDNKKIKNISITKINSNSEFINYMNLSRTAGIIENQLYIHNTSFNIKDLKYNRLVMDGNLVVCIRNLI